jgi:predicted ester cyclase
VLKDVASEDFRDLRHGGRGERGMERVVLRLRESFPDLAVSVEGQEADYDLVRTHLTLSDTDRGGVLWYPPIGRRVTFSAAFEDQFSGGTAGRTRREHGYREAAATAWAS